MSSENRLAFMMTSQPSFVAASPLPGCNHACPTANPLWTCTASARNINAVAKRLAADLPRLFKHEDDGHYDLYAENVVFRDPVTAFRGVKRYRDNISFLRRSPLFTDTTLDTFDVRPTDANTVTTRWSMAMTVRVLPWRPRITFTGISEYGVDKTGFITSHIDKWDSLNAYANERAGTPAAVADVLRQLGPARAGETPTFVLLRRAKALQLRDYEGSQIRIGGAITDVRSVSGNWVRDGMVTANQVAVVRLAPGDNIAQKARDVTENIIGEKWAVPHGAACVVTYTKRSVWELAQVWEPPVRELWVQVRDVDTSVAGPPDATTSAATENEVELGV